MTDFEAPSFLKKLPTAQRAYALASAAHREQRRESDAALYIVHPLEVAALLHNTGHPESVVAAGILHDTVEDSDVTVEQVRENFDERKRALREQIAACGPDASSVYAADKVSKVREFRDRAARGENVLDPANRSVHDRIEHYLSSLSMLEQIAPDDPLVRQLRFELEMLHTQPPRPDLLATTA